MKTLLCSILLGVALDAAAGVPLLDERYGADALPFAEGVVIVGGSRERGVIEILPWGAEMSRPLATALHVLLHSASVKLDDRFLLVTGGSYWVNPGHGYPFGTFGGRDAFVLDVATGAVVPTPPMSNGRSRHTGTRLADGSVLVAGGETVTLGGFSYYREEFDSVDRWLPEAGRFAPVRPMLTKRAGHTATLLRDGRVLVVGGAAEPQAELYAPASGLRTPVPMLHGRTDHTATMLPDGRVVIAGGRDLQGSGFAPISAIEIFDPRADAFTVAGADLVARGSHAALLLADGRVMLAGGDAGSIALDDVTLFDPATGQVLRESPLEMARQHPAAVVAPDGGIVIIGGGTPTAERRPGPHPARRRPVRR